MQRARDWSGRHRQHINLLPQMFEALLVFNAKTLLLVDDDQAKILELHVGADQPVCADDDVDAAFFQPFDDTLLFAGRTKAAETFDGKRILGEALAESA